MKKQPPSSNFRLLAAVASAVIWIQPACPAAEDAMTHLEGWEKAEKNATQALFNEHKALASLARDAVRSQPASGDAAMLKLNLLLRAGLWKEALVAVDELHALCPSLEEHLVSSIYYAACDQFEAWEVGQRVAEVFADHLAELSVEDRTLNHLVKAGWSIEQIDAWLAARPEGVRGFWMKLRVHFNARHGRAGQLIEELSQRVRSHPEDIRGAVNFLDALVAVRNGSRKPGGLSWIAETCWPAKATEALEVGRRLQVLQEWSLAVPFYRFAIATPLTAPELRDPQISIQLFSLEETVKTNFVLRAKRPLSECLLQLGQKEEAQRLMEETVGLGQEQGLSGDMLFAGRTQQITGLHTVEDAIREQEKLSADDPQYWRERARYYQGRSETGSEEEAHLKEIALTPAQPAPDHPGKGNNGVARNFAILDYATFLRRQRREGEAVALLLRELRDIPADYPSAEAAARLLAFHYEKLLVPEDETYWRWLAARPQWSHTEQRLLWELLQRVGKSEIDSYLDKAEKLAAGAHPSRNTALGWIMNRMKFAARSIPLLKDAAARAEDDANRNTSISTLFDSYLDLKDWRQAETIFYQAVSQTTPRYIPNCLARIAVIAAKADAKADAMRLWQSVANLNACYFSPLDDLSQAGLRPKLQAFYEKFRLELATSTVPDNALKVLTGDHAH